MDLQTTFIIFGVSLALLAVLTTLVGMRVESFPSRGVLAGLLILGVFLVVGTTTFAVKLAQHEQHEREEGELAGGEEASVAPVVIPPRV